MLHTISRILYGILFTIHCGQTILAMEQPMDIQMSLYDFLNTNPAETLEVIEKAVMKAEDKQQGQPAMYMQLLGLTQLVFSKKIYKEKYDDILGQVPKPENPNTQIQKYIIKGIRDTFANTFASQLRQEGQASPPAVRSLLYESTNTYIDIETGKQTSIINNVQRNLLVKFLIKQTQLKGEGIDPIKREQYFRNLIEYINIWINQFQYSLPKDSQQEIEAIVNWRIESTVKYFLVEKRGVRDLGSLNTRIEPIFELVEDVKPLNLTINKTDITSLEKIKEEILAIEERRKKPIIPTVPKKIEEPEPEEVEELEEPIEEIEEPIAEEPVEEIELIDPVVTAFDQFTKKLEKLARTVESM